MLESGRELRTLEGHSDSVNSVVVTPDGKLAVSASWDKTLVWDVESGRELRTLEGHSDEVYGVAVTADGKGAVSAL
jgi:WD40 repeat protein